MTNDNEKNTITPERKEQYRKAIRGMRYLDDDFFNACLQGNPDAALRILRIVMRKPDLVLVGTPETQKTIKNLGRKSIRFDLFCKSENKYYDVEIQRNDKGAGSKRARYYVSIIDAGITVPGEDYDKLPDIYVIFITEKDVMGAGLPYYSIERKVEELNNRAFNDGTHILYVNGAYEGDDDFGKLMHDFRCVNPHEMYFDELKKPAIFFKETEKGVEQMCKVMEDIRNDGIQETKIDIAIQLIHANKMTDEEIASACGLTVAQVKDLREQAVATA